MATTKSDKLDEARAAIDEWEARHQAAQQALDAAEAATPIEALDDPEQLGQLVQQRAIIRESARVTAGMLQHVRDVYRQRGKAMLGDATARYIAQAEQAEAELEQHNSHIRKLIGDLCEATGTDAWWQGRHVHAQTPEAKRLADVAYFARRSARLIELAQDDADQLVGVLDAVARRENGAAQRHAELLGQYAGVPLGVVGHPLTTRRHLPPELQPGGIYPLPTA